MTVTSCLAVIRFHDDKLCAREKIEFRCCYVDKNLMQTYQIIGHVPDKKRAVLKLT